MTTIALPTHRVLSGRDAGKKTRDMLNLNKLDNERNICVIISDQTWSLNTSFFIGCFKDSIKKLGARKFEEVYRFAYVNTSISSMVADGISRCEGQIEYEGRI